MISLGVDIGGTGAKCVAFMRDGREVALSYHEYAQKPGTVGLAADALLSSVLRVISECVQKLDDPKKVCAITVSSFGESFVPIDAEGQPLTDIIMYFADTQSEAFAQLVAKVGSDRIMEIARVLPDASYSLAKMLYTRSIAAKPVWKFLPIAAYICYALSGVPAVDVSLACRTLLYDVRAGKWSQELLDASSFSEHQMPTVVPSGTALGRILPQHANALGLCDMVQVVFGSHDQLVNALACGVSQPGEAFNGAGTTECIVPLFESLPENMDFYRLNYAAVPYFDGRGYVTYAYNLSGGSILRWFRNTFAAHLGEEASSQGISIYDLLAKASDRPSDLLMLPFLQGKGGTPDVVPNAKGLLYGLTMDTQLADVYRAALEGLTMEIAYNLETLEPFGVKPSRLYACGGGARSRVWLQIKADMFSRTLVPLCTEETGALGSAILGFAAVSGEKDRVALAKQFVRYGEPIEPNAANKEIYAEKYRQYKLMRASLLEVLRKDQCS